MEWAGVPALQQRSLASQRVVLASVFTPLGLSSCRDRCQVQAHKRWSLLMSTLIPVIAAHRPDPGWRFFDGSDDDEALLRLVRTVMFTVGVTLLVTTLIQISEGGAVGPLAVGAAALAGGTLLAGILEFLRFSAAPPPSSSSGSGSSVALGGPMSRSPSQ